MVCEVTFHLNSKESIRKKNNLRSQNQKVCIYLQMDAAMRLLPAGLQEAAATSQFWSLSLVASSLISLKCQTLPPLEHGRSSWLCFPSIPDCNILTSGKRSAVEEKPGFCGKETKQITCIHTYMWNLGKWYRWSYLQSRRRDRCREQTYGYQGEMVGRINW